MSELRVVVVEDEEDLRAQVVDYLELSGFTVVGLGSAAELYRHLAVEPCDIIVLDLRLPDEDGLAIARHLRCRHHIGIIMMTARGATEHRVQGFEAGADVYMPKPVELRELAAAARNLGRRVAPGGTPTAPAKATDWAFDEPGFQIVAPNGAAVPLTATELSLMRLLIGAAGSVVPRGALLAAMGYDPGDPGNRNLDAAIRRLREKTKRATGQPLPVRTVQSIGYAFAVPRKQ